ncbi:hypothetical protein PVA8_354 [Vibrio phage PVA8]|nr:hypothetical protein [Vibrio phage PC-Liy1]URQ03340.1 hypothetical protein PVA8_354 [Vibrio phage PVA8]WBM59073.1 hypothetical protein vBValMPVA8_351 [Vibrio phage vB_ValM_PVA8]
MSNFKANLVSRSTITVNNKTYHGTSVTIKNGKVVVDGRVQDDVSDTQVVNVNIEGDCTLVQNENGDINCRDVHGDASTTNGDVECDNVSGSVSSTNGDIKCGNVGGSVSTNNGDIIRKW